MDYDYNRRFGFGSYAVQIKPQEVNNIISKSINKQITEDAINNIDIKINKLNKNIEVNKVLKKNTKILEEKVTQHIIKREKIKTKYLEKVIELFRNIIEDNYLTRKEYDDAIDEFEQDRQKFKEYDSEEKRERSKYLEKVIELKEQNEKIKDNIVRISLSNVLTVLGPTSAAVLTLFSIATVIALVSKYIIEYRQSIDKRLMERRLEKKTKL